LFRGEQDIRATIGGQKCGECRNEMTGRNFHALLSGVPRESRMSISTQDLTKINKLEFTVRIILTVVRGRPSQSVRSVREHFLQRGPSERHQHYVNFEKKYIFRRVAIFLQTMLQIFE
jgi:hypothetical protein